MSDQAAQQLLSEAEARSGSEKPGYRRPITQGQWWSVSVEEWTAIKHTTRLKTLEHIGRIMETSDGEAARILCEYCRAKQYSDCRVYSAEAHRKGNTRKGCARCIRAKINTRCMAGVPEGKGEIAQLSERVEMLENKLAVMKEGSK